MLWTFYLFSINAHRDKETDYGKDNTHKRKMCQVFMLSTSIRQSKIFAFLCYIFETLQLITLFLIADTMSTRTFLNK